MTPTNRQRGPLQRGPVAERNSKKEALSGNVDSNPAGLPATAERAASAGPAPLQRGPVAERNSKKEALSGNVDSGQSRGVLQGAS